MTEPLPCPFCGHVGLSHHEGTTFRWLATECNGCGAQCGEERIDTLSKDHSAAIEQAKEAAITTWNTRFTPFPPQQQAEPVMYVNPEWLKYGGSGEDMICESQIEGWVPLYTAPPRRKELSASEILNMMPSAIPAEYDGELMEFARAVEAKLKEQP